MPNTCGWGPRRRGNFGEVLYIMGGEGTVTGKEVRDEREICRQVLFYYVNPSLNGNTLA